jgi:hypothetical protein
VSEVRLRDPCWPGAPALGGRLVVALCHIEDAAERKWTSRLWWLQLNPDGDAIVGAERAFSAEMPGARQVPAQELLPSVGTATGGTLLLAYLAESRYQGPPDLWVCPIAAGEPGRGPRALRTAGRKLAENCAHVMPAFSADGRWVYAWRWVDRQLRPERLAVPIRADGPPGSQSGAYPGE